MKEADRKISFIGSIIYGGFAFISFYLLGVALIQSVLAGVIMFVIALLWCLAFPQTDGY